MTVLSWKSLESVVIGGVTSLQPVLNLTVLEIPGRKLKAAFETDPHVPVQRSEVWERTRAGELPDGPTEDFTEFTVR
jgi:sRNA-binding carbon storage regulator CsrA